MSVCFSRLWTAAGGGYLRQFHGDMATGGQSPPRYGQAFTCKAAAYARELHRRRALRTRCTGRVASHLAWPRPTLHQPEFAARASLVALGSASLGRADPCRCALDCHKPQNRMLQSATNGAVNTANISRQLCFGGAKQGLARPAPSCSHACIDCN